MTKTNVYLQYPWKFPDSSYYKNILDFPPKGIDFINYKKGDRKMEVIGSSKKFESMRKLKNFLRKLQRVVSLPNIKFSYKKNADLIHCAHCLPITNKPWVIDTEVYDRISAAGQVSNSRFGKFIIRKFLESKNCKKIICWSQDCKKTFEDAFPNNKKILNKITLLHFALDMPKFKKIKSNKVRILFVARWFDAKGGRQTLEVFDSLTKKYPNVETTFVCPTPNEFKLKYKNNSKIKIYDLMPQEKLFREVYPAHDIFFYPGFGDSYGFAIPEALSFGLPIITVDSFARKELLVENKNGFIIDRPQTFDKFDNYSGMDEKMLSDLTNKTSLLIEDIKLREVFSKNSIKMARTFFSIEKRNKVLQKIYLGSIE